MVKARKAGVNTPYILYVDLISRKIIMQYVEGITARDYIEKKQFDD